jgi:biopolymer transport protein ExbD
MTMSALERRTAHKARGGSSVDLNLVSLIDVFTILIFFLLSQVGPPEMLTSPKAVQLPMSTTDKAPRDTLVLVVSDQDVLVDGRKVVSVSDVAALKQDLVASLKAELDIQAKRVAVKAENRKDTNPITILADKEVPYRVLKKLMVTCAAANFGDVSFGLRRKDGKADL